MNRHMVPLLSHFRKAWRVQPDRALAVSAGEADKAGVAVKKPEGPKLGSGSVAASLDES